MCDLSQGVKVEGREEGRREGRREGISIGKIGMLVQLVQDGDLKPERAAEKAKMTVEEFKKVSRQIQIIREAYSNFEQLLKKPE